MQRGLNTAGVIEGVAEAGLEFIQGDHIVVITTATAGDDALPQRQRLTHHQLRIDLSQWHASGKHLDGILHFLGINLTIAAPAVMKLIAQPHHQP